MTDPTSTCRLTANLLRQSARAYASATLARLAAVAPHLGALALPSSFAEPAADLEVRVLQLAAAVEFDRPALLEHNLAWYRVAFHHRQVPADYLLRSTELLAAVLGDELPPAAAALARRHLQIGLMALTGPLREPPSHLRLDRPHGRAAAELALAVLENRGDDAMAQVRSLLQAGVGIPALHDEVLGPVLRELGRMWLLAEIPIADEHFGTQLVDRVLWLLQDLLPKPPADAPVVATLGVGGNLHDLGLRMVAQRLAAAGCAVRHFGPNLPASDLEWLFADRRVDLVALSATMALHLPALAATVAEVRRITAGKVPVLVGGEPFRLASDLVQLVGADAGAVDAAGAVSAALALLKR
ncbi:MAG: cobalamin B12-binding domain-containing protein [Planctomycetes bacterium]|nr:cobalamin B12-binding domain-containing protein [Planctomycetota bacterium]